MNLGKGRPTEGVSALIQLLYGDDLVSVEDALASVTADSGPEDLRDVNHISLRDDDLTPNSVAAAAFTVPFMADRRTVVVKDLLTRFERSSPRRGSRRGSASSGRAARDPLGEWSGLVEQLDSMPPTTDLIFVDGGLSRNNPMLRRLSPMSEVREFRMPSERDLPGWIANRAATIGVKIDRNACAVLADAVGRQPMLIDSELRKLALYRDGRSATSEDVREMVAYVREANIFQAVDAVIDGRTDVALRLVGRIMDDGSPAAYVMTMIARQIRLLLMANDLMTRGEAQNEIGSRIRLSGWVLNKTLQQARRISRENLEYMHGQLVETDLLLKTKPIDEQLALEMLIAELTTRRF